MDAGYVMQSCKPGRGCGGDQGQALRCRHYPRILVPLAPSRRQGQSNAQTLTWARAVAQPPRPATGAADRAATASGGPSVPP